MFCLRLTTLISALSALLMSTLALPDSAGNVPLPGPGLSYGGIPYGSVSGNVAGYFSQQAPSGGRSINLGGLHSTVDYAPIEQYLR